MFVPFSPLAFMKLTLLLRAAAPAAPMCTSKMQTNKSLGTCFRDLTLTKAYCMLQVC